MIAPRAIATIMLYAAFVFRGLVALAAGWIAYMIVAVVDVLAPVGGIDGFIGIFIQAAMGVVFTSAAVAVLAIAGSPLYLLRGRRWGAAMLILCIALFCGGVISLMLSHHPHWRVMVEHPEFGVAGPKIAVGNPSLMLGGWLSMMFGLIHAGGPGFARSSRRDAAPASVTSGNDAS